MATTLRDFLKENNISLEWSQNDPNAVIIGGKRYQSGQIRGATLGSDNYHYVTDEDALRRELGLDSGTKNKTTSVVVGTTAKEKDKEKDEGFNLSSIFGSFMNNTPAFDAPSESEMRDWASSYAEASINPLLSAIQTRLTKELAAQENAKREVEAAYAGLPEKFQARLDEARNYALNNAIARGMGRSGVVNWETEKRTTPIMLEQAQADREKAAKLTAIANAIAAAQTTAAEQTQSAKAQKGNLEAARFGELQQWAKQMAASQNTNNFNQALGMANLYNNSQANSLNSLLTLLPYLMGGD